MRILIGIIISEFRISISFIQFKKLILSEGNFWFLTRAFEFNQWNEAGAHLINHWKSSVDILPLIAKLLNHLLLEWGFGFYYWAFIHQRTLTVSSSACSFFGVKWVIMEVFIWFWNGWTSLRRQLIWVLGLVLSWSWALFFCFSPVHALSHEWVIGVRCEFNELRHCVIVCWLNRTIKLLQLVHCFSTIAIFFVTCCRKWVPGVPSLWRSVAI